MKWEQDSRDGEFPAVYLLSALGYTTHVVFNECFVNKKTNEIKLEWSLVHRE
ncbi:MAG: hypothetical protein IEMM0008_0880 [bacterium]|nr:MAG: hypothetical protein IEMM0008_0880 [bacterium]